MISIGNITAGGTGKTPFTLFLARELLKHGKKIAVLSRGYRSSSEHRQTPLLACDGRGPIYSYREMGDEPYLIAKKLPEIFLYTGKNRCASSELAEKKAEFLLLDDGFQYQKLKRDLEIVMIDPDVPLKGFLPFGYLRDFPARLKNAHVAIAKVSNVQEAKALENSIPIPLIGVKPVFTIKNRDGKKVEDPDRVALFCGIARPDRFAKQVQERGIQIITTYFAADHSEVPVEKFSDVAMEKGAKYLLCTEKDLVKLEGVKTSLPILCFEMDFQIIYGEKVWGKIIEKILDKRDNSSHEK